MTKSELRIEAAEKRAALSASERQAKSTLIVERLMGLAEFINAKKVLAYYSHSDEVAITGYFDEWSEAKELFLPRLMAGDSFEAALFGPLQTNKFGIPEPSGSALAGNLDLILVPGLAFDRQGNRLGMGKGYYDRFLSDKKGIPRVGLAFSEQILASIPKEPYDEIVDIIITDSEIITTIK